MEKEKCVKCALHRSARTNKLSSEYPKDKEVEYAFIYDSPGLDDDASGRPLMGTAGATYIEALQNAGLKRSDVFTGCVCRCRGENDRAPKAAEVKACLPYLLEELKTIKPKIIVCFGRTAAQAVLADKNVKLGQSHGRVFSGNDLFGYECVIIPTWHPSPKTFKSAPKRKPQFFNDVKITKRLLNRDLNTEKDWKSLGVYNLETWNKVKHVFFNADIITIDIETNTLDKFEKGAIITNVGLTTSGNYGISVVCDEVIEDSLAGETFNGWTQNDFIHFIADLTVLLDEKLIVGHGMKFDVQFIEHLWHCKTRQWYWDTSIGHSIAIPGDSNKLKDISWNYTNMGGYEYELAGGLEESTSGRSRVDYNNGDIVCTHRCMDAQIIRLDEEKKLSLARNIVMPAAQVFSEMEFKGVRINIDTLKHLDKQYVAKLAQSKNELHLHGTVMSYIQKHGEFNPNSPKQMSEILFSKKYCGYTPLRKTESKQNSTDKRTLQKLKAEEGSELCGMLLEYKKLSKLYSTYIKGMYSKIINGRVHTNYYLDIAVTGRTTSSKPNLQNIPKDSDIKSMFEADEGFMFVDMDYNQMELVVSTYYTGDRMMMDAIASGDAHTFLAQRIFGMTDITEEDRRFIKTLNFGVLYGMGAGKLADALEMPVDDARKLIAEYFRLLPRTQRWIKEQRLQAEQLGWVSSKFNRKRYYKLRKDLTKDDIPDYNSAVNHPIQSCASDLMLYGMVQWRNYLKKTLKDESDAYMILQVHDSIITCTRTELVHDIVLAKKKVFEATRFKWMTLPLTIDIEVGKDWGNTEKINF